MPSPDRAPAQGAASASRPVAAALALGAVAFALSVLAVLWVGPVVLPWVALPVSWAAAVGVAVVIAMARGRRRGIWMPALGAAMGLAFPVLVSIAP